MRRLEKKVFYPYKNRSHAFGASSKLPPEFLKVALIRRSIKYQPNLLSLSLPFPNCLSPILNHTIYVTFWNYRGRCSSRSFNCWIPLPDHLPNSLPHRTIHLMELKLIWKLKLKRIGIHLYMKSLDQSETNSRQLLDLQQEARLLSPEDLEYKQHAEQGDDECSLLHLRVLMKTWAEDGFVSTNSWRRMLRWIPNDRIMVNKVANAMEFFDYLYYLRTCLWDIASTCLDPRINNFDMAHVMLIGMYGEEVTGPTNFPGMHLKH